MSFLGLVLYRHQDPKFSEYFDQRKHIWIEKMDMEKNVKAVQSWINEDTNESKQRYDFLVDHIENTTGVFDWFFSDNMFTF